MPVVPSLEVERYLDFKDMTAYLRDVGKAAPHLVRVFSIGKSREGRPLLVAEVTNRNLKKGREKPGLWIDGGHQGWNLLGTMGCLELLRFLVSGHGRDEFLTDLVDHNVFYIAPRLAPDEMEICLLTGAVMPQTPDRAGPLVAPQPHQFRVESPLGSWTPYKRDSRLLVRRQPEDRKGPFYDLYRQLDTQRLAATIPCDFPTRHGSQNSDGPLQLASSRAVFEFLRSYQNVFGVISTSGPGDQLRVLVGPEEEPWYRGLSQRLGELSGLPVKPVAPTAEMGGQFMSWAVESLGVISVDCQMWSLRAAAGLKEDPGADPFQVEETEMMQILRFVEKDFPANCFSEWTTIDEPDLGAGERGGWDWSKTWLNPPAGPYLGRELKRFSRLALGLASAGPRLVIAEVSEKMLGWSSGAGGANEPLRHLCVRVENRGFLPTCPLGRQQSDGASLSTQCIKGQAELLIGDPDARIEDLQGTGFSQLPDGLPYPQSMPLRASRRFKECDFLFRGNADIEITVSHPMAGSDKVVSRPTQIMKPPAFGQPAAAAASAAVSEPVDHFEDAFPSFEELYEPEQVLEAAPPTQKLPAPPQPAQPRPRPAESPTMSIPVDSEFGIPMPAMPAEPAAGTRKVEFPSLGGGEAVPAPQGPFPAARPGGRVFGTPPQKPGSLPGQGGGAAGGRPSQEDPLAEGDFSPLPFVKAQSTAFEPLTPKSASSPPPPPPPAAADLFDPDDLGPPGSNLGETMGTGSRPPSRPAAPSEQQPSAPPARLSRISAPQLLRRQRGGQPPPGDPFAR